MKHTLAKRLEQRTCMEQYLTIFISGEILKVVHDYEIKWKLNGSLTGFSVFFILNLVAKINFSVVKSPVKMLWILGKQLVETLVKPWENMLLKPMKKILSEPLMNMSANLHWPYWPIYKVLDKKSVITISKSFENVLVKSLKCFLPLQLVKKANRQVIKMLNKNLLLTLVITWTETA